MNTPAINSIESAKEYALCATTRRQSEEETRQHLHYCRTSLENAPDSETKSIWTERIKVYEQWLASDEFKQGKYPQGIDDLVLNLVDWRATVYAFQRVKLDNNTFQSCHLFSQWQSGAGYAIACILGKLTSKDKRDNSIVNVWKRVSPFMVQDHACTSDEASVISRKLHRVEGHFTNANSKAILLRNKMIAHNESSPHVEWDDLDHDIAILARIWALIVGFCSYGIVFAFPSKDVTFDGLGNIFSVDEVASLQSKHFVYANMFKAWTRTNLATGEQEERSPAFAEIRITTNILK